VSKTPQYINPNSNPETPSKYNRPRRYVMWWALLFGLIVGTVGGIFFAWNISPVEEFDTEPWQLREDDRAQYLVAIMIDYAYNGNLSRTVDRLITLRLPGDQIQEVANIACRLASGGYVDSQSGLYAVRSMMQFYQLQGRSGCADTLLVADAAAPATPTVIRVATSTPTLVPPATKTDTPEPPNRPTPTSVTFVVPTSVAQEEFTLANVSTFCDVNLSGIIEVRVQDFNGEGIPGIEVRARWDDGSDTFFTGLKPERGPDYADFQMTPGEGYTIELPGRSDPSSRPLAAAPCVAAGGDEAITSYRVVYRPAE